MRLDKDTLLSLCQLRDPAGVVSIYVGSTPDRQSHEHPEWEVAIRNGLKQLRQTAKADAPKEKQRALFERLDALEPELLWLYDPKEPGRGRAVFAPVSEASVERVALQLPFPDEVVWEERAYVRPLVAAYDEGRPAGIAIVDGSGVRVLEWRFGEAEELGGHEFSDDSDDWRELKGPAMGNPARPQETSPQRQLFEDRLEDHRIRFLKTVAGEMESYAQKRRWDRLVVAGLGKLAQPFLDALPTNGSVAVLRNEHELRQMSVTDVAESIIPQLREHHAQRTAELIATAKERAMSGGAGALGLRDVLSALNEGRIAHLVYDDTSDFEGLRASDGRLFVETDAGAPEVPDELTPETHLLERMIERSLDTGAEVTPAKGEETEALDEHDGVAAILRW